MIELRSVTHEGGDLETFLDREMASAEPSLRLAQRLAQRHDKRMQWRVGVYFPLLGAWRELPLGERES